MTEMTREDIIAMARETGGVDIESNGYTSWVGTQTTEFLERFAALIASRVAATAKAEEREALENADWTTLMRQGGLVTWGDAQELGDRVVDAIRARGEKQ